MTRKKSKVENSPTRLENTLESNIFSDQDDAPEAVPLTASKAEILKQIKTEREALRQTKERRRLRSAQLEEQSKLKKQKASVPTESESESEEPKRLDGAFNLAPLPANVLESALNRKTTFASDDEASSSESTESTDSNNHKRALALKNKLISSLPFQVAEVGRNGLNRITRQEAKARVSVVRDREAAQLGSVRRIAYTLDRNRKPFKSNFVKIRKF